MSREYRKPKGSKIRLVLWIMLALVGAGIIYGMATAMVGISSALTMVQDRR